MMKTLYYSVDVDGNELDLEHDLNYVQDELMVLKILFDIGVNRGFSNSICSHLFCLIDSVCDCVDGINQGFSYLFIPNEEYYELQSLDPYVL